MEWNITRSSRKWKIEIQERENVDSMECLREIKRIKIYLLNLTLKSSLSSAIHSSGWAVSVASLFQYILIVENNKQWCEMFVLYFSREKSEWKLSICKKIYSPSNYLSVCKPL